MADKIRTIEKNCGACRYFEHNVNFIYEMYYFYARELINSNLWLVKYNNISSIV